MSILAVAVLALVAVGIMLTFASYVTINRTVSTAMSITWIAAAILACVLAVCVVFLP